jgi:hypothetical protein
VVDFGLNLVSTVNVNRIGVGAQVIYLGLTDQPGRLLSFGQG